MQSKDIVKLISERGGVSLIYLDNAATTLRKPRKVGQAQLAALHTAAGAGRSGHRPAMHAAELLLDAREAVAALFHVPDSSQVVFTYNATHALNLAIYALCDENTQAAISNVEHNSVVRPLATRKIPFQILQAEIFHPEEMLTQAEKAIEAGANLFIINAVSNVFGQIAPLEALDALLTAYDIPMILDASQSAGILPLDVQKYLSLAAVCMPGHKALYGPTGTGILLVLSEKLQKTLLQGGTGSASESLMQPSFLPDRFESGTLNVCGIAGLAEGIHFVQKITPARIFQHEQKLLKILQQELLQAPETQVFTADTLEKQCGVLSFRHDWLDSERIAEALAEQDICVRAGLHCAPLAHQAAGTLNTGTVRISLSIFNTPSEMRRFGKKYRTILRDKGSY